MNDITPQREHPIKKDFLLSYTEFERSWATWIAWHLEQEGYSTVVPDWDFLPGSNKIYALQRATEQAEHIIALFSPQYINTLYTHPEWATAFRNGKSDEERRFFPVLVEACEVGGVLEHIVPVNLIGLDEEVAQARLLEAIKGERRKGHISPPFPGKQPRFLGCSFSRNPLFVGREQILKTMYKLCCIKERLLPLLTLLMERNN